MNDHQATGRVDSPNGSDAVSLHAKVDFLSQPTAYKDATSGVERIETHMAWVFLTDQHAWKLKKPVRHDFLDFSTPALRRADGEREVQLNRRLAPHIYLGVVPLYVDADGQLALGDAPSAELSNGERTVDWLVKMHRLPANAALDHCIESGTLETAPIRRFTERLIDFYQHAPQAEMNSSQYRERFVRDIHADRQALLESPHSLSVDRIERITDGMLRLVRDEPRLLDLRVERGRVVEAHGDLRPQHVYLVEPVPVVIDCLEFNADFRLLDPLDELSFFALECERLGGGWVGRQVQRLYQQAVGDTAPQPLLDFYTRRQGLLRAKLAIWHTTDDTVDHHDRWVERAKWYLRQIDPGERAA